MHETDRTRRLMGRRRRWALLLALMLMMTGAGAESLVGSQGIAGEARMALAAWPDLTPTTLGQMQAWLKALRLRLYADQTESSLELLEGERQVLRADSQENALTLSAPGSLPPTHYLGKANEQPLETLFGLPALPDFSGFLPVLPRVKEALLQDLAPYGKADAVKTSIKQVGRASSRLVYTLTAEEAAAWWQGTLPALQPLWAEGAKRLPPAWQLGGAAAMASLGFTGKLTIRRLLDEAGMDLGFQATGRVDILGRGYRLDLTAGQKADTGFYLSVKLPAQKGRDKLEGLISLAYAPKEGSRPVKGEYSLSQVEGGDKRSLSGKVNLALTGTRLSGEVTAQARLSGSHNVKRDHRLLPDFSLQGAALDGSLRWMETEGKNTLRDLTLFLVLAPGSKPDPLTAQSQVDLAAASAEALAFAKRQAAAALLPFLQEKLLALPQDARLLVLHDWGRVRRALSQKESPLVPDDASNAFTVAEDTDTLPATKEETP